MKKLVKYEAIRVANELEMDNDFEYVWKHTDIGGNSPDCGIHLKDGQFLPTLICAVDVLGNYTVVLRNGGTHQYLSYEVA